MDKGELSDSDTRPANSDSPRPNLLSKLMDDFKWWNCDYPNPDTTCIEGKIIPYDANSPSTVTLVGLDYKMLQVVLQKIIDFK